MDRAEKAPETYFDEEKQKKGGRMDNSKMWRYQMRVLRGEPMASDAGNSCGPHLQRGTILGGSVSPVFTLVCLNCANTKFFNALVSKVLTLPEKKEGEDGK